MTTTLVSPIALARTAMNTNLIKGGKGEAYAHFVHSVGRATSFSTDLIRNMFVAASGTSLPQHAGLVRLLETGKITVDDVADSLSVMLSTDKSKLQALARETELESADYELATSVAAHLGSARFTALTLLNSGGTEPGSYADYIMTDYGREILGRVNAGEKVYVLPPGITESSDLLQVALPPEFVSRIGNGVKVVLNLPELRSILDENPRYSSDDGLVVDTLKKIKA